MLLGRCEEMSPDLRQGTNNRPKQRQQTPKSNLENQSFVAVPYKNMGEGLWEQKRIKNSYRPQSPPRQWRQTTKLEPRSSLYNLQEVQQVREHLFLVGHCAVFSMHYGNEIKNAFLPIFFSYLIPPFLPWSVHSKVNVQWTVPKSLLFSSYWSRLANRKPQHKMSRRKEMYGKAHAFFPLHLWGDCSASLIALQSVQVSNSQLLAPSSLCPAGLKDIRTSHTNLKGGMDFLSFACFLFLAESQDVGEIFSMMPDL